MTLSLFLGLVYFGPLQTRGHLALRIRERHQKTSNAGKQLKRIDHGRVLWRILAPPIGIMGAIK